MAEVRAPLPGRIMSIKVEAGAAVKTDQELFVMEALKMENTIVAPEDGIVEAIRIKVGDDVEADDLMMEIRSDA